MTALVLFDEVVYTDYGQLTIEWGDPAAAWDGDADRFFAGQVNGWVGAAQPGHLLVVLARRSGGSAVRIERHAARPGTGRSSGGDAASDVVETSIVVEPGSTAWLRTWAAGSSWELDIEPGAWRVRVTATGRDDGRDGEFSDHVVDSYVVELWPEPVGPDEVIRVVSSDARSWHDAWGGRRHADEAD